MTAAFSPQSAAVSAEIRVRGLVQGVGFRPAVWRWATELGLTGEVLNDGDGVVIRVAGPAGVIRKLEEWLQTRPPSGARVDAVEAVGCTFAPPQKGFRIVASKIGETQTSVPADVAICRDCRTEILDPNQRRYGYAFATCTSCGPRLSIIEAMPYDRTRTTMAGFEMCAACRAEYENPADRRFHAETIACADCGPQVSLVALAGDHGEQSLAGHEAIEFAANLLRQGRCIAIKGLGGYQLACDATNAEAVSHLRGAKRRPAKPLALMARDIDVVRRHACVTPGDETAMSSCAAPIVLLHALPGSLPEMIAPGLDQVGFMLAATPLHVLLLASFETPLVLTSGNVSNEPQIIDDNEAMTKLAGIASHALMHDRPIAMRLDDTVAQGTATGVPVLRLGRGLAPLSLRLPDGFENAPQVLAYGAELKAAACLIKNGSAIVGPHQGDLAEAATLDDYGHNLTLFERLHTARPRLLACDLHPDYASTRAAQRRAKDDGISLVHVQHHHAHIASCLAEHGVPLDAPPVLGIALDGTGMGDDGTAWGCELLIADYRGFRRVGRLKPVAMPGGDVAAREPWRNLYAHLAAGPGWRKVVERYGSNPCVRNLLQRPLATIDAMIASGLNAPQASSAGRLFDAVAAACGLAPERVSYEGEAAMRLEAVAARLHTIEFYSGPYAFEVVTSASTGLVEICLTPMWLSLLDDLARGEPDMLIAARFHDGFAQSVAAAAIEVVRLETEAGRRIDTVALSGGVFHNRFLADRIASHPGLRDIRVLRHEKVPTGDGGLSLGQAAVAAARSIPDRK